MGRGFKIECRKCDKRRMIVKTSYKEIESDISFIEDKEVVRIWCDNCGNFEDLED